MQRIAIIGAGKGGTSLLKVLKENANIRIVGICDVDPLAPGIVEARRLGIKTFGGHRQLMDNCHPIDLLLNVTNDPLFGAELETKDQETEIINGRGALLVWELTNAQQTLMEDAQKRLIELQDLYELALRLSASGDLREVYSSIIDYATKMTDTPAGSIALLDESSGEMVLASAKGFSNKFYKLERWKLRKGGLTSYILNQEGPVVVSDIHRLKQPANETLIAEGVKSLMAVPLTVRGKTVGLLYCDDFKSREFEGKHISLLSLLSGYAALAIEKMKLLDDTKKMAITDGLTGLFNQQEFLRLLESELSRAERYNRPLSVVAFDVDFFKRYNDEYGHVAGNHVLRLLAQTVRENSRATDLCARTGGEEFTIVMPETDYQKAAQLAERLRKIIENLRTRNKGEADARVTASIGVASFPEHGASADDLYRAVDQALYKAKERGRNTVVGFPDRPVTEALAKEAVVDRSNKHCRQIRLVSHSNK